MENGYDSHRIYTLYAPVGLILASCFTCNLLSIKPVLVSKANSVKKNTELLLGQVFTCFICHVSHVLFYS